MERNKSLGLIFKEGNTKKEFSIFIDEKINLTIYSENKTYPEYKCIDFNNIKCEELNQMKNIIEEAIDFWEKCHPAKNVKEKTLNINTK